MNVTPGALRRNRALRASLIFLLSSVAVYGGMILTLSCLEINNTPLVYRFVKGLVWKGGHTLERFDNFRPETKYDILVFGSSTANRSIDPATFKRKGLIVYNLGTDDQTPLNTEILVKHYVPLAKPKLVILDLYNRVFCQSPYESAADIIQNCNSDKAALNMALQLGDIRGLNMLAVRMATEDHAPILKFEDTLCNGFRPMKQSINDFSPDNYRYYTSKKHLDAFEKTLAYLQKKNIPVLLTIQPKPVYYLEQNRRDFRKDIEPILRKYNLSVLELTMPETGLQIVDYADISHLNANGAVKYSEALVRSVQLQKILAENQPPL